MKKVVASEKIDQVDSVLWHVLISDGEKRCSFLLKTLHLPGNFPEDQIIGYMGEDFELFNPSVSLHTEVINKELCLIAEADDLSDIFISCNKISAI